MATQWQTTLANKIADVPGTTTVAQNFYNKYKTFIERYRGGMPAAFMAAIAAFESGGKMVSGDSNLAEYGFFQISADAPKSFGIDPEYRKTVEGNIFLAGVEYNVEAKRLALKYPGLVIDGTADQWKLARLVFAIGRFGTDTCIKAAKPSVPGNIFGALEAWADATGAIAIGSSPAGKIWMRIKAISLVQWEVAKRVGSTYAGSPSKPPAPGGMAYYIPTDVRPHLTESNPMTAILIGSALLLTQII